MISAAFKVRAHERMLATACITSLSTAKKKKDSQQGGSFCLSPSPCSLCLTAKVCEVSSSRNLPSTSGVQVKSMVIILQLVAPWGPP